MILKEAYRKSSLLGFEPRPNPAAWIRSSVRVIQLFVIQSSCFGLFSSYFLIEWRTLLFGLLCLCKIEVSFDLWTLLFYGWNKSIFFMTFACHEITCQVFWLPGRWLSRLSKRTWSIHWFDLQDRQSPKSGSMHRTAAYICVQTSMTTTRITNAVIHDCIECGYGFFFKLLFNIEGILKF